MSPLLHIHLLINRFRPPSILVFFLFLTFFYTLQSQKTASAQLTIQIDPQGPATQIHHTLLGMNLPTWLNREKSANPVFQSRAIHSGMSLVRIPGGSWSSEINWEPCESQDICNKGATEGWIIRPTEYIKFLKATGRQAMYTLNANGTSQEAAALVAYFNGSISDTKTIGIDKNGKDWETVGKWARLRQQHSPDNSPDPYPIIWWEFGNEFYGGKSGTDCQSWGWETAWTCDGYEYIHGIGSGANRHEGYLEFRAAMQAVDPSIKLGAIGVAKQNEWGNWGNEVIAEAGNILDFYIIHQYAYFNPPTNRQESLTEPQTTWPSLVANVNAAFDTYAGGRRVPLAVTEYNMFSSWDRDPGKCNGKNHPDDTDYGLVDVGSSNFTPYPQYYVFPLWSNFGSTMIPVQAAVNEATTLSLYGGKINATTMSLLAINKTGTAIPATVKIRGKNIQNAMLDQVTADMLSSLSVLYNNIATPYLDFSNAPSLQLSPTGGNLNHSFPKYSITLLRLSTQTSQPPPPHPGNTSPIQPGIIMLLDE